MSMSINLVKIKPKGINIEYHGSDTSGVRTMVWYYFIFIFIFFLLETYFPLQKQGVDYNKTHLNIHAVK